MFCDLQIMENEISDSGNSSSLKNEGTIELNGNADNTDPAGYQYPEIEDYPYKLDYTVNIT